MADFGCKNLHSKSSNIFVCNLSSFFSSSAAVATSSPNLHSLLTAEMHPTPQSHSKNTHLTSLTQKYDEEQMKSYIERFATTLAPTIPKFVALKDGVVDSKSDATTIKEFMCYLLGLRILKHCVSQEQEAFYVAHSGSEFGVPKDEEITYNLSLLKRQSWLKDTFSKVDESRFFQGESHDTWEFICRVAKRLKLLQKKYKDSPEVYSFVRSILATKYPLLGKVILPGPGCVLNLFNPYITAVFKWKKEFTYSKNLKLLESHLKRRQNPKHVFRSGDDIIKIVRDIPTEKNNIPRLLRPAVMQFLNRTNLELYKRNYLPFVHKDTVRAMFRFQKTDAMSDAPVKQMEFHAEGESLNCVLSMNLLLVKEFAELPLTDNQETFWKKVMPHVTYMGQVKESHLLQWE